MASTFNTSCSDSFSERLKKRFGEGKQGAGRRSEFVVKVLTAELDRLDQEGLINAHRDIWIKDKVIPALKKMLKREGFEEVVNYLTNADDRERLISQLKDAGIVVSDKNLLLAIHGVLADYD
jgi:hypothetical protein